MFSRLLKRIKSLSWMIVKPKYKIIQERNGDENGPAALATIARYYHHPTTLEDLCSLINIRREEGTSLRQLAQAAAQIGFSPRPVQTSDDMLEKLHLPAIAHCKTKWGWNFVILYDVNCNTVLLGETTTGSTQQQSRREFCQQWTGYLLLIEPQCGDSLSAVS